MRANPRVASHRAETGLGRIGGRWDVKFLLPSRGGCVMMVVFGSGHLDKQQSRSPGAVA